MRYFFRCLPDSDVLLMTAVVREEGPYTIACLGEKSPGEVALFAILRSAGGYSLKYLLQGAIQVSPVPTIETPPDDVPVAISSDEDLDLLVDTALSDETMDRVREALPLMVKAAAVEWKSWFDWVGDQAVVVPAESLCQVDDALPGVLTVVCA